MQPSREVGRFDNGKSFVALGDFGRSSTEIAHCVNTNPYNPPRIERGISPRRRIGSSIVAIVLLYPLIVLTSLYATWGLATLQLGRPPIPYREYPDGLAITVLSWVTAILHICAPIAVPLGFVVSILFPFARLNTQSSLVLRIASLLTYTATCAAVFIVLSRDPHRVVGWFWD